jgi:hypothetical protein
VGVLGDPAAAHRVVAVDDADQHDEADDHDLQVAPSLVPTTVE